jgi:Tfp pilus assembly protein PilF
MKTTKSNKNIAIIGIVVLALIATIYYSGSQNKESLVDTTDVNNNGEISTTTDGTETVNIEGNIIGGVPEGAKVTILPSEVKEVPEIYRSVVLPEFFKGESRSRMMAKVRTAQDEVSNDKESLNKWFTLGGLYNEIQDWEGAIEIYEFLASDNPQINVLYTNMGTLYHLHLKDYEKSEENFRKALDISTQNQATYLNFYDLYRYSYKTDTEAGANLLKEALVAHPNNTTFTVLLAKNYEEKGLNDQAKSYYVEARNIAASEGNTALVEALEAEINEL